MYRIGEFSQMGQVSIRMLRHYDKLGLLKPNEVDTFSGYRYYTLDQLPRLNRIIALKELGFSLEQVGQMLDANLTAEQLRAMYRRKQQEIAQQLEAEQRRLMQVAIRLRQIEQEGQPSPYEVVLKQSAPQVILSMRRIIPSIDEMPFYRCKMFQDIYDVMAQQSIKPAAPELAIYHMQDYREEDLDTELAVPIPAEVDFLQHPAITRRELSAETQLASIVLSGSVYDLPIAMVSLLSWVKEHDYCMNGPAREIHLSGRETPDTDFENITFELQAPIEKT